MINVLLSLNTDLASSIAIRYTNELTSRMKINLQEIHVVDPVKKGSEPGTGWVRKTWENALVETGKNDILHFLEMEKLQGKRLRDPKVLIGDRTEKILTELQDGDYHLFIEGIVPTLSSADFYHLVSSRLYRLVPCPVLVVKNLIIPDKAALIFDDRTNRHALADSFKSLFKNTSIPFDLLYLTCTRSGGIVSRKDCPENEMITDFKKELSEEEFKFNQCRAIEGSPKKIADMLREYGLIGTSFNYSPKKNSPLMEVLGDVPSPVLICWQ